MSTALLIVDFQYDFLPGGALAVADGHMTQPVISKLARAPEVGLIVMSRDWHPRDHISFSDRPEYKDFSWPPHCVQETHGAEFDEMLLSDMMALDKPVVTVTKGDEPLEEAYSAFDGHTPIREEPITHWDDDWGDHPEYTTREASLASVLDLRYGIDKVIVTGLALDYCVKATALDAVSANFETIVPLDATRPVSYLTGGLAIRDLSEAGAEIT